MGSAASTLQLNVKPDENSPKTYKDATGDRLITVTRSNYPLGSTQEFYRYTHKWDRGKEFKLEKVLDDGSQEINVITTGSGGKNVTSVSAYYWKYGGNVLIVGITTKGSTIPIYYGRSNGNNWIVLTGHTQSPLSDEELLETYLDQQNCKRNNTVTLDLSFKNSESHSKNDGNDNQYCCHYHKSPSSNDQGKVTVASVIVSCQDHNSSSTITAYKHTINSGGNYKLAKIKYYDNGKYTDRRRIKISGLDFTTSNVQSVSVFYCQKENPLLIYIEDGSQNGATGWYNKPTGNGSNSNGDEQWEEVPDLHDITHSNLGTGSLDHQQWSKLVEALQKAGGCKTLGTCPLKPKTSQPSAGAETKGVTSGGSGEETTAAKPGAQLPPTSPRPGPGSLPNSPNDSSGNLTRDIKISIGVPTGILGTSALACFAGYKFYTKYKGDPWVRQI